MEQAVIGVLVVDDNPRVRRALEELINATAGMRALATARDLTQALDADERVAPVVALVDVLLPRQADGIAVVRALSRRGRSVVATSVSAAVRQTALAAGASRFVEKGPDTQSLLAALRSAAPA